jgi:formate hydrogenlyase subunit 6/NADH:ubiquinone oxidoreductase subunit I
MSLYLSKENIPAFVASLADGYNIFFGDEKLSYQKYDRQRPNKVSFGTIRPVTPIKSFFFVNNEVLSPKDKSKPNMILGVKACDLKALRVLDKIFLEGVVSDPFYEVRRKNTVVLTSDCPEPGEKCFCTLVENKPFCEDSFDINFSLMGDGYIVDTGSDEGEKIVKKRRALFGDISEKVYALRDRQRENSIKKLKEMNKDFTKLFTLDYQKLMKEKFTFSQRWKETSKTCVQCLGCNNICPSCYCFLISEEQKDSSRYRWWDACHSTSYARVAGGLNPRPKLHERFRNRYQCKFNYRKENFGEYACTGCGRCIEVCPGKIDIREIISQI